MPLFTSVRERRLWIGAGSVAAAVLATVGLGRTLAGALGDRTLALAFGLGVLLIAAGVVTQGLRRRPGRWEVGVGLAVAGAFLVAGLRLAIPAERSHLIEYGAVALLVYEALAERARQGRPVPRPALLAIAATVLLGGLDEGVQALVPGRVLDPIDVVFNGVAAVLAVGGRVAVGWARRRTG